jgi:hypothetical protein
MSSPSSLDRMVEICPNCGASTIARDDCSPLDSDTMKVLNIKTSCAKPRGVRGCGIKGSGTLTVHDGRIDVILWQPSPVLATAGVCLAIAVTSGIIKVVTFGSWRLGWGIPLVVGVCVWLLLRGSYRRLAVQTENSALRYDHKSPTVFLKMPNERWLALQSTPDAQEARQVLGPLFRSSEP